MILELKKQKINYVWVLLKVLRISLIGPVILSFFIFLVNLLFHFLLWTWYFTSFYFYFILGGTSLIFFWLCILFLSDFLGESYWVVPENKIYIRLRKEINEYNSLYLKFFELENYKKAEKEEIEKILKWNEEIEKLEQELNTLIEYYNKFPDDFKKSDIAQVISWRKKIEDTIKKETKLIQSTSTYRNYEKSLDKDEHINLAKEIKELYEKKEVLESIQEKNKTTILEKQIVEISQEIEKKKNN